MINKELEKKYYDECVGVIHPKIGQPHLAVTKSKEDMWKWIVDNILIKQESKSNIPSDEEIKEYANEFITEAINDCNSIPADELFEEGAKWMRDKLFNSKQNII